MAEVNGSTQADERRAARRLAVEFNNRAWDLIEQATLNQSERDEMLDAAHAARALWRIATGSSGNIEALRAHHAVGCAAYRAGDLALARAATALAMGCDWTDGDEPTRFDHAMTMVLVHLTEVLGGGYIDPKPLMEVVGTLASDEREVLSRILPWPRARFFPAHA